MNKHKGFNKNAYLVRAYTSFNVGDDLFLKILFEKYPNQQFVLFTRNNSYVEFVSRYRNVTISYFNKVEDLVYRIVNKFSSLNSKLPILLHKCFFYRRYKKCAGYIHIGGSVFIQNQSKLSRKDYVFESIVSVFSAKPKFIIGANFGPVKDDGYKLFYEKLFREFTDVCFRESYSYKLFQNLKNIRYASDIVFQLKLPEIIKEPDSIGFSVIDLNRRENLREYTSGYCSLISNCLSQSIDQGKNVYLISFCAAEGDEAAISEILSMLDTDKKWKVKKILYNGDIDVFLPKYLSMESVFTTRFHAMVLSILAGQNIFPLIYSDKMKNVLDDLGYTGKYLRIDEINEHLDEKNILTEMINNRCPLKDESLKSLEQFKVLDLYLSKL